MLFRQLYQCTPKIHMQGHIELRWRFGGYLLSCFGPERRHRFFKRVMRFAYREYDRTVLAYDVRTCARVRYR